MGRAETIDAAFLGSHKLPVHDGGGDKETRGRVLVVGGGRQVAGAVLLSATAALRSGAGKLQIATVASVAAPLALAMPEALVTPLPETDEGEIAPDAAPALAAACGRADAVLIGPGMLDKGEAGSLVAALLESVEGPAFVLDAAALTGLSGRAECARRHRGRLVATPHAGEMAVLTGLTREAVEADPVAAARRVAAQFGCTVAMKGACTRIVSPAGETWWCDHGAIGLATSGSGDVLAGIAAGLLARGAPPVLATQWAVFLHAEAGHRLAKRLGPIGYLARELPGEIPSIMADLAPRLAADPSVRPALQPG